LSGDLTLTISGLIEFQGAAHEKGALEDDRLRHGAMRSGFAPAHAEIRILASPGGESARSLNCSIGARIGRARRHRRAMPVGLHPGSGHSAERPHLWTRRAVLGFHAARSVDAGRMYAEPEASEVVLQAYPEAVRGWILRRGGLSSRLLLLRGRELAAIYPRCR